jgi:hypothetical protein
MPAEGIGLTTGITSAWHYALASRKRWVEAAMRPPPQVSMFFFMIEKDDLNG